MNHKRTFSNANQEDDFLTNKKCIISIVDENIGLDIDNFYNKHVSSKNEFNVLMYGLYDIIKKKINLYEIKYWLHNEINKIKKSNCKNNDLRNFYDIINTFFVNYGNIDNDIKRALLLFELNAIIYSNEEMKEVIEILNFLLITRKTLIRNARKLNLLKENETNLI